MKSSRSFVLVKNEHDLDRIRMQRPDLLGRATILAGSPHAALLLREAGAGDILPLGDLLSDAERLACVETAHRLSRTWHELFDGAAGPAGRLVAQLTRDDLLTFFIHATAADRVIRSLVGQYPGSTFWTLPGALRPSIWQSEYECSHGLIEAAIAQQVDLGGATLEHIVARPLWHPFRIANALTRRLTPGPAAVMPPTAAAPGGPHPGEVDWDTVRATIANRPSALVVGDDHGLQVLFGYAPALESMGLTVAGASTSVAALATATRTSSGAERPFFRLASMGSSKDDVAHDVAGVRQQFEKARLTHPEAAISNPHLAFQYDHVLGEMAAAVLRTHDQLARVITETRPSLVLVGGHGFNSHAAAVAARSAGLPSVLVQHGGALMLLHGTPADAVWAWGLLPSQLLRDRYGWPDRRVVPVGAPQLAPTRARAEQPVSRNAARERFGVSEDGTLLLVLSSGFTDGPWQPVVTRTFIESWDRLMNWTATHPNVTVVLRPHPLMDMNRWYRDVARTRKLKNLHIASEGSVDDIVFGADVVVAIECTTTAALVAHAARQPVLHVRASRWSGEGDAVWTREAGLTIADRSDALAPLLDTLLTDPAARAGCVAGGNRFLDAYASGSDVTPRAREAAEALVTAAAAR